MGACQSSEAFEEEQSDESIVYVLEDKGLSPEKKGIRKLASLYSKQGKKAGPNQDAVILCKDYAMEDGLFCGVFDGHGRNGHFVSKLVRDYLPSLLLSERNTLLSSKGSDSGDSNCTSPASSESSSSSSSSPTSPLVVLDEWKEACIHGFRVMDSELKLQANLDSTCSGTTAVVMIKQSRDLIIANLGDSRAVLGTLSEDGSIKAIQLSTDLKPGVPQEAERIRKNNGRIFSLRGEPHVQRVWLPNENSPGLAMARAFGDFQLKNYGVISVPEVSFHNLTSRDQFIILATDGIWDVLSNDEVVSTVRSAQRKEDAALVLVEAAVHAWKAKFPSCRVDDCSAACLFFQ